MPRGVLRAGSAVLTTLLVAARAPGARAVLQTLAAAAAIALAGPLLRRRGRTFPVRIAADGAEHVFHVDHLTDLQVLREVWCARIYDASLAAPPRLVLDVGANIGATVAYFKHRWPAAVVHAFEPDPRAFAKLQRNAGRLAGVTLHRAAIGGEDGDVTLWSSVAAWESSVLGPVGPGARPVTVPQYTLASAVGIAGDGDVDLLKLDAEGAEFAILPQISQEARVRALVAELHFDLVPTASLADVLGHLSGFELDLRGESDRRMELTARRRAPRPVS